MQITQLTFFFCWFISWKNKEFINLIDSFFMVQFHCVLLRSITKATCILAVFLVHDDARKKTYKLKRKKKIQNWLGKYILVSGVIRESVAHVMMAYVFLCLVFFRSSMATARHLKFASKKEGTAAIKRHLGCVLCKERQWNSFRIA